MIHGSKRLRPNGRWQFTAEVGRGPDGSRIQAHHTVGGTGRYDKLTEREAERKLHEWLGTLEQKGVTEPCHLTVAEYLDRWMDEQRTTKSLNTLKGAERMAKWFRPRIGKVLMADLRPEHIQLVLNAMKDEGLTASTIKTHRAWVSAAMNRSVKQGLIDSNPVASTVITKPRKTEHNIWSVEHVRVFKEYVGTLTEDRIYGQAALLAAMVGPRKGEVVALRREDFDPKTGALRIRRNSTKVAGGNVVFHDTKSQLGVRDILLPEPARLLLRDVLDAQEFQPQAKRSGLLFATPDGEPLHHDQLTQKFKVLAKSAGLPVITFHELRTSAATFMIDMGIDPTTAADILGHDPKVLMSIYRQVHTTQKQAAAEKIAAALAI